MEESNPKDASFSPDKNNTEEKDTFNLIEFDSDIPSKSVFQFFGYEFLAPTGMKNPALIYMLFVVVNIIVFLFIKSKL